MGGFSLVINTRGGVVGGVGGAGAAVPLLEKGPTPAPQDSPASEINSSSGNIKVWLWNPRYPAL